MTGKVGATRKWDEPKYLVGRQYDGDHEAALALSQLRMKLRHAHPGSKEAVLLRIQLEHKEMQIKRRSDGK